MLKKDRKLSAVCSISLLGKGKVLASGVHQCIAAVGIGLVECRLCFDGREEIVFKGVVVNAGIAVVHRTDDTVCPAGDACGCGAISVAEAHRQDKIHTPAGFCLQAVTDGRRMSDGTAECDCRFCRLQRLLGKVSRIVPAAAIGFDDTVVLGDNVGMAWRMMSRDITSASLGGNESEQLFGKGGVKCFSCHDGEVIGCIVSCAECIGTAGIHRGKIEQKVRFCEKFHLFCGKVDYLTGCAVDYGKGIACHLRYCDLRCICGITRTGICDRIAAFPASARLGIVNVRERNVAQINGGIGKTAPEVSVERHGDRDRITTVGTQFRKLPDDLAPLSCDKRCLMGTASAECIGDRMSAAALDTAVQHRRGNAGIHSKRGKGQTVVRGQIAPAEVDDHGRRAEIAVITVVRAVVCRPVVVCRRCGQNPCAVLFGQSAPTDMTRLGIDWQSKDACWNFCRHFVVQITHGVLLIPGFRVPHRCRR